MNTHKSGNALVGIIIIIIILIIGGILLFRSNVQDTAPDTQVDTTVESPVDPVDPEVESDLSQIDVLDDSELIDSIESFDENLGLSEFDDLDLLDLDTTF
ncbi:hypothetical protein COB64_01425 [Candidatus Wolfebacteria bacterium]|nr:MAG: hypothetical protein COB64_01425 [Candidatus Wolfebacteria bacterium]